MAIGDTPSKKKREELRQAPAVPPPMGPQSRKSRRSMRTQGAVGGLGAGAATAVAGASGEGVQKTGPVTTQDAPGNWRLFGNTPEEAKANYLENIQSRVPRSDAEKVVGEIGDVFLPETSTGGSQTSPQNNYIEYGGRRIPVKGEGSVTGLGGAVRERGSGFNVIPASDFARLVNRGPQYTYEQTVPGGPYRRVPVQSQRTGETPSSLYGREDPRATDNTGGQYLRDLEERNRRMDFEKSIENLSPGRAATARRYFEDRLAAEKEADAQRQATALGDMFQRRSDEKQTAAELMQQQREFELGRQLTPKEAADIQLEQRKQRLAELKYLDEPLRLGETEPLTIDQQFKQGARVSSIIQARQAGELDEEGAALQMASIPGVTEEMFLSLPGYREWKRMAAEEARTNPESSFYGLGVGDDPRLMMKEYLRFLQQNKQAG